VSGCNCGSCQWDEKCQSNQCIPDCIKACAGKECGSQSGCDCGDCGYQENCVNALCKPDCPAICAGVDCGYTDEGCDCGACDPYVTSVSPDKATFGKKTTFTVKGGNLPGSVAAWIGDCADLDYGPIDSNKFTFNCTPKWNGTGSKDGVIKTKSGGTVLKDFTVNVTCSSPTVVDVAPLSVPSNSTITFTASGACIPPTAVAWIAYCGELTHLDNGTNEFKFKCKTPGNSGKYEGVIKSKSGGTVLMDFEITVN